MDHKETTTIKQDYLKEDPEVPGQKYALISMMEPKNSNLLRNRESYFCSKFLEWFLTENENVRQYREKHGEKKLTNLMKEKLNYSYENVCKLYYEYVKNHMTNLESEFQMKHNTKNEPVVTGLKVRAVFPDFDGMKPDIEKFHLHEPAVDIYTVPVGKWVPYLPGGQNGITAEYTENRLNALMNHKHIEMEKRKLDFDDRMKVNLNEEIISMTETDISNDERKQEVEETETTSNETKESEIEPEANQSQSKKSKAKKRTAKKLAAKKPAAKKPRAKKQRAKKPAAEKPAAKKPRAKKRRAKQPKVKKQNAAKPKEDQPKEDQPKEEKSEESKQKSKKKSNTNRNKRKNKNATTTTTTTKTTTTTTKTTTTATK